MPLLQLRTILAGIVLLLVPVVSPAAEIKSRYATISFERDDLLRQLNREVSLGSLSYLTRNRTAITFEDEVRNKIDALIERIETVLDMFPRDFRLRIVLLPSAAEVRKVYKTRYGLTVDFIAFYAPRDKTIFLSVDDTNLDVAAHELAHAVIDQYFGVSPPAKIHEVLAHFVETHLKD